MCVVKKPNHTKFRGTLVVLSCFCLEKSTFQLTWNESFHLSSIFLIWSGKSTIHKVYMLCKNWKFTGCGSIKVCKINLKDRKVILKLILWPNANLGRAPLGRFYDCSLNDNLIMIHFLYLLDFDALLKSLLSLPKQCKYWSIVTICMYLNETQWRPVELTLLCFHPNVNLNLLAQNITDF